MYGLFIFEQITAQVVVYVNGLAFENPCKMSTSAETRTSRATYILAKIQGTVMLFYSLYYLGMIVPAKVFSSIRVPLLRLSDRNKFRRQHNNLL
jgi:hypothetical protein